MRVMCEPSLVQQVDNLHFFAPPPPSSTFNVCDDGVQDGVMVLGATQRYGTKFVTTVLYKPLDRRESAEGS